MSGRVSGETVVRRVRRVVPVASPAAGTDWSVRVPGGFAWRLLSVTAQLVSAAAVADRSPVLVVTVEDRAVLSIPCGTVQKAGATLAWTWADGVGNASIGAAQSIGLPRLVLGAGDSLAVVTGGLQAADAWSSVALLVLEDFVQAGPVDLAAVPDLLVAMVEPVTVEG